MDLGSVGSSSGASTCRGARLKSVSAHRVLLSARHRAGRLYTDEDRSVYTMLRTMSEDHLNENIMQAIPVDGVKGS